MVDRIPHRELAPHTSVPLAANPPATATVIIEELDGTKKHTAVSSLVSGGATQPYQHDQPSASALWTVNHNLGRTPASVAVIVGGAEAEANVQHITVNQLTIAFDAPQTGSAHVF